MNEQVAQLVGDTVLKSLQEEESKVDAELTRLNNMDDDDLDRLREKRLRRMKQQAEQVAKWKVKGHGEYTELKDQQDFFETTKRSKHVVIHFYSKTNQFREIVDKHLQILTTKHMETKFCKIDAEKSDYLVRKLGVWMMPTMLICIDREVTHAIAGFNELGGSEKFSTQALEYTLSLHNAIKYDGPVPETFTENDDEDRLNLKRMAKSSARRGFYDSDED